MLKLLENVKTSDLKKMGFKVESGYMSYWDGCVKIWIKDDGILHFNTPNNDTMDLLYDLIDNGFICKVKTIRKNKVRFVSHDKIKAKIRELDTPQFYQQFPEDRYAKFCIDTLKELLDS